MTLYKDEVLAALAARANVAQFVSFGPGEPLRQRHARVRGLAPDRRFGSPEEAVRVLLERSAGSVNVRSFEPARPRGREFLQGLRTVESALVEVRRLAREGLHTIVNETLDVHDGGVSGVVVGDLVEFAPEDTPRCVEQPGVAALPRDAGLRLLRTVYGFEPALGFDRAERVEFSLHPLRVGERRDHTVIWEVERVDPSGLTGRPAWPNRFSRFLGDKLYGLLVADVLGLPVPDTTVLTRRVAPFRFGEPTGTGEPWLRTCPAEQVPGHFPTRRGWTDPLRLLGDEPGVVAVLAQEGVDAAFSGALLPAAGGGYQVEGVPGYGDEFMLGRMPPADVPAPVREAVGALAERAAGHLGPVRMEWVHDGERAWVLQLHLAGTQAWSTTIVAGEPRSWERFDPADGLGALRALVDRAAERGSGIEVVAPVGLASHVGDVLRRAGIPSRLAPRR